jgi:hypothetical protein
VEKDVDNSSEFIAVSFRYKDAEREASS